MKDDIAALFEHETDDAVPAEHEARIRAGLASLLASGAGSSAPTAKPETPSPTSPDPLGTSAAQSAAQSAAVKLTTAVAIGAGMAVLGFGLGRATAPLAPAPVSSVTTPAKATPVIEPAPSITVSAPSASSASAVPTASAARPADSTPLSNATSSAGSSAFDREQSLLERAQNALVRHDPAAAEEALVAAERQFPRSRHAEERDYLRIQVLRERGKAAEARERARAFLTTYPDSLLRARVEPIAQ